MIDTGSQITFVSKSFYKSLDPVPELGDIKDFYINLSVQGAAGNYLPYKGYTETQVSVPFLSNRVLDVPILVVSDTDYNLQLPVIIGTMPNLLSHSMIFLLAIQQTNMLWQK